MSEPPAKPTEPPPEAPDTDPAPTPLEPDHDEETVPDPGVT